MKKEDKKGTNKKKIKWLIVGYSLLFIFLSISYLLSSKFPDIWSYETLYFSTIYFLTLPFVLGIEIPKKKIIYPLYFLAAIAISWITYRETYLCYSLFTLLVFTISVTPLLYPKTLNNKVRKVLRIVIPIIFLAGSIFLVYQELGFNNNYIDTDFDTDTSYDEGIYISPSFLGNYKSTIIDDQKNIKEMRLVISDKKNEFDENLFSDVAIYYNTTLDIYENETLKKRYYFLNKSLTDDNLTFECLASYNADNPSKLDKTLLGSPVDLTLSNNTYTMNINFITNSGGKVVFSKVAVFDDTTQYTNVKEYYFYDAGDNKYKYTYNEPTDKKVLSHYVCNTNDCNLYVESDYFAVIREDKSYYVYNVKTGNIINSFTTKEKYLVVNLIAKNNFPSGIILEQTNDYKSKVSYYDFYYGKETINAEMCDYIYDPGEKLPGNYLFCKKNNSTNLVNTKGEIVKEEVDSFVSSDDGTVYFYESVQESPTTVPVVKKLYDKNFNIIYTDKNDGEKLDYDNMDVDADSITFVTNKKIYTYKGNTKVFESKTDYKEIYKVSKNYIVVNKNDYVTIIDPKEKVIATVCKLSPENKVKYIYTKDGTDILSIYVFDPNIVADEIEVTEYNKDILSDKEKFEKYKKGHTFYEYDFHTNESKIEKKAVLAFIGY